MYRSIKSDENTMIKNWLREVMKIVNTMPVNKPQIFRSSNINCLDTLHDQIQELNKIHNGKRFTTSTDEKNLEIGIVREY